jgi:hypothetical protein
LINYSHGLVCGPQGKPAHSARAFFFKQPNVYTVAVENVFARQLPHFVFNLQRFQTDDAVLSLPQLTFKLWPRFDSYA